MDLIGALIITVAIGALLRVIVMLNREMRDKQDRCERLQAELQSARLNLEILAIERRKMQHSGHVVSASGIAYDVWITPGEAAARRN